jgi:hypothetical protein
VEWGLTRNCFVLLDSVYRVLCLKQQPSAVAEGATSQHARGKQLFAGCCCFKAPAQSPGKRGVLRSEKLLPPTLTRHLVSLSPWFGLEKRERDGGGIWC